MRSNFSFTDEDKTFADVNNANIYSGNGDIEINGRVGCNTRIYVRGKGTVRINGPVAPDAKFYICGPMAGDLYFTTRPPESVLRNMEFTGGIIGYASRHKIHVPGGLYPEPGQLPRKNTRPFVTNVTVSDHCDKIHNISCCQHKVLVYFSDGTSETKTLLSSTIGTEYARFLKQDQLRHFLVPAFQTPAASALNPQSAVQTDRLAPVTTAPCAVLFLPSEQPRQAPSADPHPYQKPRFF